MAIEPRSSGGLSMTDIYTKIDDIKTLGKEILWYNSNIRLGHRLVYYK